MDKLHKNKRVGLWVLTGIVSAIYLVLGLVKFDGGSEMQTIFLNLGLPGWFFYFVGWLEATGALMLIIPQTAALGAALLAFITIGAVSTLIANSLYAWAAITFGLFPILVVIGHSQWHSMFLLHPTTPEHVAKPVAVHHQSSTHSAP